MNDSAKLLVLMLFLTGRLAGAQLTSASAYVPVQEGRLYFEECGGGSRTVVLLHDGVVDSAVWNLVWPSFCQQFHVLRYDRRGYGRSAAAFSSYSEIMDLVAVLDYAKVGRVSIVGSSHGGQLAIDFTLAHPDRVDKLVLVGPVLNGMPFTEHFLHRADAPFKLAQRGDVGAALVLWSRDRYLIAPGNEQARRRLLALLKASPQDMTHNDFASSPPPAIHRLAQIKTPTLIVTGSADIADVHAHSGAIEAGIYGAKRVIISDTGHILYLEKPKSFSDLTLNFLSSN